MCYNTEFGRCRSVCVGISTGSEKLGSTGPAPWDGIADPLKNMLLPIFVTMPNLVTQHQQEEPSFLAVLRSMFILSDQPQSIVAQ